jgi:hypothetical protein
LRATPLPHPCAVRYPPQRRCGLASAAASSPVAERHAVTSLYPQLVCIAMGMEGPIASSLLDNYAKPLDRAAVHHFPLRIKQHGGFLVPRQAQNTVCRGVPANFIEPASSAAEHQPASDACIAHCTPRSRVESISESKRRIYVLL